MTALDGAPAPLRALYDGAPDTFAPAGPYAAALARLGEAMTWIAALIFLLVLALLLAALWRRRDAEEESGPPPSASAARWVLGGGMLLPILVLGGVFLATLSTLGASSHRGERPALDVEVIGHQWWWEVRYPGSAIVTADEIHIPVGRLVRVTLVSADVIHSFWVPQLNGKTDVLPGSRNTMFLAASRPGSFRGQCAEYCGAQHAHMALSVVAHAPADFERWRRAEQEPARPPADSVQAAGREAFLGATCRFCHAIRGTPATGRIAPDLTHIGSRLTLAGGTLPNTPANMGGWILDPERLKPGTTMPAVPLAAPRLNAIVQYLQSLK